MQRRHLLQSLVLPAIAGGCVPPMAPPQRPPPGGLTADAAYPPVGARWRVRVAERVLFQESATDQAVTASAIDFKGRPGYGLASPTVTKVLDPATFNTFGTIEGGRVAKIFDIEAGPFSWPLWVGKSWSATYSYTDLVYGRFWGDARSEAYVVALENVAVPAGTFQAFRIEYRGGLGTDSSGSRHTPGLPGIESHDTYWYAPAARLVVKSVVERIGTNYRGAGRTTTELLGMPT